MRADAFLAAADALPLASLDALLGSRGLVVVAPHPDDESLGCGGLIAAARASGRPVHLVVVSDRCGSHTQSRLHEHLHDMACDEAARPGDQHPVHARKVVLGTRTTAGGTACGSHHCQCRGTC